MRSTNVCLRTILLVSAVALSTGLGCAGPEPDTELANALQAAREAAQDTARGEEAIALLEAFVQKYPADVTVPEALMQLAVLRQQQGDMVAAVADYRRILESFPTSEVADGAQFMIAFVCEEHLHDLDAARSAYQAVIDNYPDSELVSQAQQLLAHVGQDPDTWVPGFQEGSTEDPQ